jgi:hypothetical protein
VRDVQFDDYGLKCISATRVGKETVCPIVKLAPLYLAQWKDLYEKRQGEPQGEACIPDETKQPD